MANQTQITQLYQELLGRAPDTGGLQHYSKYGDIGAVRSEILGSNEYKSRSAPAPASNPLQDFATQQKQASDALLTRQKQEQEGLFTNYEGIRKNQEALPALYNRLQSEAGVPQLGEQAQMFKNEIYKTKDRLDRLGEDVVARTTGYNVSDAQRRRLETAEAEPLQTNLGRLGTGLAPVADMLSSAQRGVETQMGLQTQQQERELEPVKMRINSISDRFARELTGFTSDRELQLTGILDKLQRDRQLADRDWELAQTLAAEERAYARQKATAASALASYNTQSTQPKAPTAPKPAVPISSYLNFGSSGGLVPLGGNSYPAGLGPYTAPKSNFTPFFGQSINSQGNPLGLRL